MLHESLPLLIARTVARHVGGLVAGIWPGASMVFRWRSGHCLSEQFFWLVARNKIRKAVNYLALSSAKIVRYLGDV